MKYRAIMLNAMCASPACRNEYVITVHILPEANPGSDKSNIEKNVPYPKNLSTNAPMTNIATLMIISALTAEIRPKKSERALFFSPCPRIYSLS